MLRIRIQGGKKKGKILQGNLAASNGIIHIIDTALDNVEPAFKSDKEVRSKIKCKVFQIIILNGIKYTL